MDTDICLRQIPSAIWRMFYSCPRKALVRLIASSRQSLLLMRLCFNMSDPPQGLQTLLWRMCSQMLNPLHYLHGLLVRLCSQMLGPAAALLALASFAVVLADARPTAFLAPASTTLLVWLCSQMLDPPLNLQWLVLQGLDFSLRTNHGQPSVTAKFSLSTSAFKNILHIYANTHICVREKEGEENGIARSEKRHTNTRSHTQTQRNIRSLSLSLSHTHTHTHTHMHTCTHTKTY